jgi:hypothetical protein
LLSRRFAREFRPLQDAVRDLGAQRAVVLRIFALSRNVTRPEAQLEHWREFIWVDQEYRIAVQRLARFCAFHRQSSDTERGAVASPVRDGVPAAAGTANELSSALPNP